MGYHSFSRQKTLTTDYPKFCVGMPRVRPDCRSVYGHVTAEFSPMGSLPHFLTHGAPLRARELRYHLYFPLFHYRLSNTVNLEGEPFMRQHLTGLPF